MKLYGYWRSSASWRVRIGLHIKGLDFETRPVHLVRDGGEQLQEPHRARNAMAQVPVLELDDGTHLTQSLPILEYLEEIHPSPPLLPEPPLLRARARQMAEIVNAGIQPLQNLTPMRMITAQGGQGRAFGAHWIRHGLQAIETLAQDTAGSFLVGDNPTLADLCLVPQLYNARRFEVDLTDLPILTRVEEHCARLEAFKAAHPSAQPDATA